ncbi:MAG: hypothetical protein KC462_08145 [Cyanobacteria bacterium HKST-UBA05]|nr:hypothetical protein [Cyanobacteria bacterium HKST-UBA05]
MLTVKVDTDINRLAKELGDDARQLPFAFAMALTNTAEDVRLDEVRRLPQKFTIRNKYVARGIRKTPATKANLVAYVGSVTPFMGLQESGGTKTPTQGGMIAVPITGGGIRTSFAKRVTPGLWVSKQIEKPRTFTKRTKSGNTVVMRRVGKESRPIKPLYVYKPSGPIKARWDFGQHAPREVNQRVARHLTLAFKRIFGN